MTTIQKMQQSKLIGEQLDSHGLKKTPIRREILKLFMDHDFALSARDILTKMPIEHDRVTVYRALNSFEEHGLLHRASEDGQGIKYAMCNEHCREGSHADKHVHLHIDKQMLHWHIHKCVHVCVCAYILYKPQSWRTAPPASGPRGR